MCFSLKFEEHLLGAWIQLETIYMNVGPSPSFNIIIMKFIECLILITFSYLILIISWATSYHFLCFTHKIKEAKKLNVLLRVLYLECSRCSPLCLPVCEALDSKLVSLQCATKPSQAEPLSSGRRIKFWKCAREPTSPAGPDLGKEHPGLSICIQSQLSLNH